MSTVLTQRAHRQRPPLPRRLKARGVVSLDGGQALAAGECAQRWVVGVDDLKNRVAGGAIVAASAWELRRPAWIGIDNHN